jgi:hypothetical protein
LLLVLSNAVPLRSESLGTRDHILLAQFLRFPQPGGPGPRIYIPQKQGGPAITLGTGFPFYRLLRLAGLRWRYCNPHPRGKLPSYSRKLLYMSYELLSTDPRRPCLYKHRHDTYRDVNHKIKTYIFCVCFYRAWQLNVRCTPAPGISTWRQCVTSSLSLCGHRILSG